MLVEGCLGFFLEESVDTLVKVVASHEVVDDSEAVVEESASLAVDRLVLDL